MKKILICGSLVLLLSSCSLLQRSSEDLEAEANQPPFDPSESRETLESLGEPQVALESEVARLNTKVSALETKLDVLTANIERTQLQRSQPIIEADVSPQANMAAPVDSVPTQEEPTPYVSSAPVRPTTLPSSTKSVNTNSTASEKEFRSAMELFQSGQNLEASSRFALFAKKYPRHLLASHALYWAGEAGARAKQWSLAMENWEELEKNYPRSAYMPEALAGLARANEQQGNTNKAIAYKDTLIRAFPKSPVALSLQMTSGNSNSMRPSDSQDEPQAPAYDEDSAGADEAVIE